MLHRISPNLDLIQYMRLDTIILGAYSIIFLYLPVSRQLEPTSFRLPLIELCASPSGCAFFNTRDARPQSFYHPTSPSSQQKITFLGILISQKPGALLTTIHIHLKRLSCRRGKSLKVVDLRFADHRPKRAHRSARSRRPASFTHDNQKVDRGCKIPREQLRYYLRTIKTQWPLLQSTLDPGLACRRQELTAREPEIHKKVNHPCLSQRYHQTHRASQAT